ncbi:MAG TPA: hypothetical protein VFZ21_30075 [Gemmatimonadaceae bacterium]|nr:hypothetical protein [Gemmatimonadaceae bacterium]
MMTHAQLVTLERSLRDERVLSVYVHGAADDPAAKMVWRPELDRSLRDLRRWLLGSSHEEREQFERSVEQLAELLGPYSAGIPSPGWCAFITADTVHDAELLPVPMPTMAVWSSGMCVAPYIRALKVTRAVILVVADARWVRLYSYRGGGFAPLEAIHAHATIDAPSHMGDVPRSGFHSGVRGQTAHDAVQRAHAVGTERMLRQAEAAVVRHAAGAAKVLVGGIPGTSDRLHQALAARLPDRVVLLDSLDVNATEAELHDVAKAGASAARDADDLRTVRELIAPPEPGLSTLGPSATRAALKQGCVRELYVTHAFIEDHTAEAEMAVREALDQGAAIEEVSREAATELDAHGGLGARLRYRALTLPEDLPELEPAGAGERGDV